MARQFERLKAALADRYAIEREIGAGGMATVYLAEDLKLHRKVAVKVLRPELAAALGPERFLREIEIAAKLHHPHILALHDSGEASGFLYYVMPYVDGESLRDRLNREKQLPVEDALQIAREVADALGSAHRRDVIHRDIKPENILLEEGHAVVADFGIARAIHAAGGEKLTETGLAVGTPAYMSPEQAMGSQELDGRSDLYSLGCVLYEMLGSEPPFTGATVESIVHQHIAVEPRPVTELRPAVPAEVVAALSRVLSKAPADRFSPAAQFAEALVTARPAPRPVETPPATLPASVRGKRNVIVYAAIAILAIIGAVTVISRTGGPPESATAAENPKLAVLPFDNLGSSEDDYFADGITEEITSRIAEISGLHVISRTSAMQYKNHNKTLQQIGEELAVDYVLEGTIRTDRAPDGSGQVRVTPQLIRVSDDAHLWTSRYTANLVPGEIFGIQEQIANQVAEALNVTLLEPERRRLAVKPTDNLEAYDYYLRGNDYMRAGWEPELLRIAVDLHSRAVALDPAFALAYTALADAHLKMYQLYFDRTEERLGKAKNAVDKALELGPELPETHVALGLYRYRGKGEYDRAVEQFTIALEGKPNNALALNAIGSVYRRQGKWSEAATYFERALALDPRSPEMAMDLGVTHHALRQYGEAERYYDRAIALGPDQSAAYLLKAVLRISADGSTARAGRVLREASDRLGSAFLTIPLSFADFTWALPFLDERGQHELAELASTTPGIDPAIYYGVRAQLHHRWQEPASARAYYDSARVLLESRVTELPDDAYFHSLLGIAYAGLDRRDDAIREGRRGVELLPISRDALQGASILGLLIQIYVMVGEHDVAIDEIENVLSVPALLSVHWLRADPFFDPLRDHLRFQALLAKYEN